MESTLSERGAEQQRGILDVGEEHQRVRVGHLLIEDGACLQDDLVGAEIVTFKENQLVLVGQVERTLSVLHDAEVKRLDASGGGIGAIVAGGEELSTAEADLDVVGARREDGVVANGHLQGHGVLVKDGPLHIGQLQELAEARVLPKDIAGLKEGVVRVKGRELGASRNPTVELDVLRSRQRQNGKERDGGCETSVHLERKYMFKRMEATTNLAGL